MFKQVNSNVNIVKTTNFDWAYSLYPKFDEQLCNKIGVIGQRQ